MKHPAYRSPADIANELAAKHSRDTGCEDCGDEPCRYHAGYREGVTTLLLKASIA